LVESFNSALGSGFNGGSANRVINEVRFRDIALPGVTPNPPASFSESGAMDR